MLGKRLDYQVEENKIHFFFEKEEAFLEVITESIMNVFVPYETKGHRSKAIEGEKAVRTDFEVKDCGSYVSVATKQLEARVYDGFYVDFYRDGKSICEDYRNGRILRPLLSEKSLEVLKAEGHDVSAGVSGSYPVQTVKKMDGDEKFYGLGDKTGFLNKRDYEYENWNSDIPQAHTDSYRALYKSIPFLITLKKESVYGIFFDNTYRSYVNLGKENQAYFYYGADAGNLDYYFIAGDTMPDIVGGYTYLTGRTPLPQLWTLGYHQSRWGYDSADCIKKVAGKYRELDIPCDTMHFDIDYMDGYRVFTWNEKDYGDPAETIQELADDGFKAVCIIDPGVKLDPGYEKYDEGIAGDYFAKTPEGEVYVNAVWPGDSVYPDFGQPKVRKWWAENQKFKFPPVGVTIKKTIEPSLRQSVLIVDMSVGEKETFSIIHQQGVIGQDGKVQQHLVHLRITVSTDGDNLTGHRIETFCDPFRVKSLRYPVPGTIIQDISQNTKHSALLLPVKCQHLFQCR